MGAIRLLPPEIVNRIAAGEVIERPASVLKELVENSLDAGATWVSIALEEGGKSLIRVSDDGSGIAREDLPLAFASHSTSKLSEAQLAADLFGIETLGFRGEALASIQAVAAVSVVSRTPGSEHAWEYRPAQGEPRPAAREVGTTVEVRNLFHNVPARRKFLRSGATELSHAVQLFTRLAISFPGVRFELAHGEKRLYLLPAVEDLRERLREILGGEALEGLVEVRAGAGGLPSLRGFVGDPRVSRRDARDQHFFVNGRWVRDRMLSHALREAYEGLQVPGNQPVAYLFLDVAPDEVDVNVHPTKAEVRFREPSQIYSLVRGAVREAVAGDRGAAGGAPFWGAPLGSPLGARPAAPPG
ncbi:MAG: DNA mismatch repair endonuclease MutL, partial [Planctomycetota bacterium]